MIQIMNEKGMVELKLLLLKMIISGSTHSQPERQSEDSQPGFLIEVYSTMKYEVLLPRNST